ncbi:hypothetical protein [Mesorhizobium wenxiniae]|uniref:Uncharacterized protein n=1 Tax=Mesorhizobium wenxiniae TaxID=2014805 RepID=A0A271KK85_9HYPH|nr:hypothetical protein [Mesorhizobium wenxiniae]PAP96116.1 hypothetical protein CIT31_05310 [Mesorhizobium wenxiniae]
MSERLKVRLAYQRGFQVVDGSSVLETFAERDDAFSFVLGKGARVWLAWSRTMIGGQSPPFDFTASFQQDAVGRILKAVSGPGAGTWFWTCYDGGARGTVATKEEAVMGVERAYTRRLVGADLPR